MDDTNAVDICRVCRAEGQPERPLFHPCICTGSIKWIHQECLVQWLRYSRKEYCELCSHRFSFTPIYSPDMPRRLPLRDVVGGLLSNLAIALKYWVHYTVVAFAWLGLVPLTACRLYRSLFFWSLEPILSLPLDIVELQNIFPDVFHGFFVVTCTLFTFLGIVWLREQIVHVGGPDWLEVDPDGQQQQRQDEPQQAQDVENDNPPEEGNQAQMPVEVNTVENNVDTGSIHGDIDLNNVMHDSNEIAGEGDFSERVFPVEESDVSGSDSAYFDGAHSSHYDRGDGEDSDSRKQGSEGNGLLSDEKNINSDGNDADLDAREEHMEERENVNVVQEENQEIASDNEAPADENQADGVEAEVAEPAENAQDDINWNPIEWDRAVDELTWERLLGLDGSLVYLEHVLWVVTLNALFIFFFAFLPYHLGNLAISGMGLKEKTVGTHFEGLINTLCGYCILGMCLVILHALASLLTLQRSKRILGLCYVIVKVSLLSVVGIGVLPLISGWWLDICSLSLFDATIKDRETSFKLAPGTSMFIHWLIGMIYIYYFASFVFLLQEVLRPGVLWFLNSLNGPGFSPIQDMIHTSIIHHIRIFLVSSIIFGTAVILMVWIPILIIRHTSPTFLPYSGDLQVEIQMQFSLELLFLQLIIPAYLENHENRTWLKSLVRLWCRCAAWIFGIQSYLLGDEDQNDNREHADANQEEFIGGMHHQALLPRELPLREQPYFRPAWFYARLLGLLLALCLSLVGISFIVLTLPAWLGRQMRRSLVLINLISSSYVTNVGSSRIDDIYTVCFAVYFLRFTMTVLCPWLPQGMAVMFDSARLKQWFLYAMKSLIACIFLVGIIPLLFGLLLEQLILIPARVPIYQTPILFIGQDWVLGVLSMKIACAVVLVGPDWRMRRVIERVYRDGIRNMDLSYLLCELAIPVTAGFSLALAVPYAIAHSILPHVSDLIKKNVIERLAYPVLLITVILCYLVAFQIRQFKKLYEHIKNDKYLVGRRLVNYDPRMNESSTAS